MSDFQINFRIEQHKSGYPPGKILIEISYGMAVRSFKLRLSLIKLRPVVKLAL